MYDANASYEENYQRGPQAALAKGGALPRIAFLEEPRFTFLGLPVHVPFGIPAGPLLHSGFVRAACEAGFCVPVYKTVRSRAHPSHPYPNVLSLRSPLTSLLASLLVEERAEPPRVVGLPFAQADYATPETLSISNSFGVPSKDPGEWQRDVGTLAPALKTWPGHQLCLSFQGTRTGPSFDDFVADTCVAAKAAGACATSAGFSLLEINLSCPNEKGSPIFKNVGQSLALLGAVRKALAPWPGLKLIAKIGVLSDAQTLEFVRGVRGGIISAVSAINTVPARIEGPSGGIALGSGDAIGGVCGALIFEQGMQMVRRLAASRRSQGIGSDELAIIAVGGVMSVREFALYTAIGADLVQAATGAMWNPCLAQDIARSCGVPFRVLA